MTTEKSFFDDLKKFGLEVVQSQIRIDIEKRRKEHENWESVIKEVHASMKYAQKQGWDHFSVNVETLTDEQRAELVKKNRGHR